eukprot:GHVP01039799.1.p2 GENE.GHVP01039799.1~~GHVP01039799.1.p2  ORF type:complete len:109 (-),score=9.85 GHVP01039799.1:200-526(-)
MENLAFLPPIHQWSWDRLEKINASENPLNKHPYPNSAIRKHQDTTALDRRYIYLIATHHPTHSSIPQYLATHLRNTQHLSPSHSTLRHLHRSNTSPTQRIISTGLKRH